MKSKSLVSPSKIVCVGLNYKEHAKELGMRLPKEPIIFLKPPTSLIGDSDSIVYPKGVRRLDYEAELAFVIKKHAKNVKENRADRYIAGYACFNDVNARDLQRRDIQWTRAKSFDTFSPVGPRITKDINPFGVGIRLYKNGVLKQASNTRDQIFSPYRLLNFISHIMLLMPGDIIATGTPKGVGPMHVGDVVEVVIDGIGTLRNKVVADR
jgi:2-keto-4-pentenoate hydratase/2-oxohepta-3-ene-1,7-dioic acid hydratase in catechol pathway